MPTPPILGTREINAEVVTVPSATTDEKSVDDVKVIPHEIVPATSPSPVESAKVATNVPQERVGHQPSDKGTLDEPVTRIVEEIVEFDAAPPFTSALAQSGIEKKETPCEQFVGSTWMSMPVPALLSLHH